MRGCKEVEYSVEVSLPECFTLPSTVKIPVKENTHVPWRNPAGEHNFESIKWFLLL